MSISSVSFENIAHNVIPEPVDDVWQYSVLICIGQFNLLSINLAAFACLSATFASCKSKEACDIPFTCIMLCCSVKFIFGASSKFSRLNFGFILISTWILIHLKGRICSHLIFSNLTSCSFPRIRSFKFYIIIQIITLLITTYIKYIAVLVRYLYTLPTHLPTI